MQQPITGRSGWVTEVKSRKGFKGPPSPLPQGSPCIFSYYIFQRPAISVPLEYSKVSVSPQERYLLPEFITRRNKFVQSLCLFREYTTFNCEVQPQNKTPSENSILSAHLILEKGLIF